MTMSKICRNYSTAVGRFCEKAILWLSIAFLALTALLSLIFTAYLPDYNYTIEFSTSQWWIVLFGTLGVLAALTALLYFGVLDRIKPSRLSRVLTVYAGVMGLGWLAMADVWPEWDSYDTLYVARALNDPSIAPDCSVPSSHSWAYCAYGAMERYPFQLPLMLVFRIVNWVFGTGDYLALEIINVACTIVIFWLVGQIATSLFENNNITNISLILCFIFLPQIFYVTFAYGNTLSMPFALAALLFQIREIKTGRLSFGIYAGLSILFAILLKSTMIYIAIGMLCTWIIQWLKTFNIKIIICAISVIFAIVLSNFTIDVIGKASGYRTDIGLPKTVWVAMGMQRPSPDTPNNTGWYNGYPASFPNGYTISDVNHESIKSIKQSIVDFMNNPKYAISYFGKKFLSEWTEPTYESLLASNWSHGRDDRPAMSSRPQSAVLHSIYYGKAHKMLLMILDSLQFIILSASCAGLILYRKRLNIIQLGMMMIPFGMVLLYLFWEAQSQYIMPAYIIMIPFAGAGLFKVTSLVADYLRRINSASPVHD